MLLQEMDFKLGSNSISTAFLGNVLQTDVDMVKLFSAYPGRTGVHYGDNESKIIEQNRKALGPSLPLTGPGWSGSGTVYTKTVSGFAGIGYSGGEDVVGKTFFVQLKVVSLTAGTQISVYTRSADGASNVQVAVFNVVAGSTYTAFVRPTFDFGNYDVWIDSSGFIGTVDLSIREIVDWSKLVLFDDPNGTVPVFSVFQSNRGCGLLLDASQGLVRGPELVTNRTTSGAVSGVPGTLPTGWNGATTFNGVTRSIVSVGSDYVDFRLQGTATGTYFDFVSSFRGTNIAVTANDWYEVDFSVMQVVAGAIPVGGALTYNTVFINGTTYVTQTATNVPRHLAQVPGSGVTNMRHAVVLTFVNGSTVDVTLRVFVPSVKKFPGNHMVQPTAAARGELSARYNQFEATEDLANAYWSIANTTPLSAAVLSPRGTMTGTRLESTGADTHGKTVTAPVAGAAIAFKKFVQRGNHDWVRFTFLSGANEVQAWFNLATGTVGTARGVGTGVLTSATITNAGNGWWECTLTGSIPAAASYQCLTSTANADLSFGRVSGGVRYEWGADLRLAADVIPSIPTYQRVVSPTDYDDVGFPVYWRAQTDDWCKSHINPNGATKVRVMWAGQKLGTTSTGIIVELGPDYSAINGTFGLVAPSSAALQGGVFGSRGSFSTYAANNSFPSPNRAALVGQASILEDLVSISLNGDKTTVNTDQGTGTYTEQDVYIGARAGTALFANMRQIAPVSLMFMQSNDPGIPTFIEKRIDKKYGRSIGINI